MSLETLLSLFENALELGLITSVTVLSLYLSYTMLNICDLSTDGCYTLGACVGAMVALSGHPYLAIPVAMLSGILSGFITAILQTKMGINSLLSGIVVNTGLYSINIAVMENASLVNLNKTDSVFTLAKHLLAGTFLADYYKLIVIVLFVALIILFYSIFLKTRLGLSIRATGDNPDMVRSSSINTELMITVGLCISGGITALSGCLQAEYQKSANIDLGNGVVTMALASLLIGNAFFRKGSITLKAIGAVLGAVIFRLIYTVALRLNMPAFMLKLISAVIVILAISLPYFKSRMPMMKRGMKLRKMGGKKSC